jgi:glycosyltransferase involved in cell wall biosynthesis
MGLAAPGAPRVPVFVRLSRSRTITDEARPLKLIIQIPCLNEAETLPITLADLPRRVPGFDIVEWLVIDDGSTDGTSEVARRHGVDHIVRFDQNRGLARAFIAGLEQALRLGADVIVNTDADNQYSASSIPDLVAPILAGKAQIVVGSRPIVEIEHFSPLKKLLQRIGSWTVKVASGTDVADAPSGFRAIHRDAAMMLNVFNNYTYTLETIIQAGRRGIPIGSVQVKVNSYLRPSRLISSIPRYISRSILTIIRIFVVYKPLRFFMMLAGLVCIPALVVFIRFLILFFSGDGSGNVQSLVLGGALIAVAAILAIAGVLADLIGTNRLLLEEIRLRMIRQELDGGRRATDPPAAGGPAGRAKRSRTEAAVEHEADPRHG